MALAWCSRGAWRGGGVDRKWCVHSHTNGLVHSKSKYYVLSRANIDNVFFGCSLIIHPSTDIFSFIHIHIFRYLSLSAYDFTVLEHNFAILKSIKPV